MQPRADGPHTDRGIVGPVRRARTAVAGLLPALCCIGLGARRRIAAWRERAHYLAASAVLDEMFAADAALLARARAITAAIDYGPFYPLMTPAAELHQVLEVLKPRHRLGMATNRSRTAGGELQIGY